MYVRPTLDGDQPTTFGVSGKLWRSALVMYDRQTRSLWSQVDGRAVAGPSSGRVLAEIPSQLTTWGDWRRRYPESLVLVKPPLDGSPYRSYHERGFAGLPWFDNRDERLAEKTLVLGVERPGGATAVPTEALDREGLLSFEIGGEALLAIAPPASGTRLVFLRPLHEGRPLGFELATDEGRPLRDLATGSRWSWEHGRAVDGPLAGRELERVAASPVYWAIWSRYFPDTGIVEVP